MDRDRPPSPGAARSVDWPALQAEATRLAALAHAPHSGVRVGAAGLVDDGRVVGGCNVENSSYGVTLCAECGLVSDLAASGGGRLVAVSIVRDTGHRLVPCGRCLQLLIEHGGPDALVDTPDGATTLGRLLPHPFHLDPGSRP
jgi:cytidine deaminase